jgi:hypothetical protein
MRSMLQIINLAIDGEVTTKEQAAALVKLEAAEAAAFYKISEAEATARLLENIGYVTGYFSSEQADKIMDLFETQHPIFGRQHPSAEEAYRMGHELGTRSRMKERENQ